MNTVAPTKVVDDIETSAEENLERRVAQFCDRVCAGVVNAVAEYLFGAQHNKEDAEFYATHNEIVAWLDHGFPGLYDAIECAVNAPDFNKCSGEF